MTITAEECGELTQRCMKTIRWGMEQRNIDGLIEEIGDVQCMINLLIEHKVLTIDDICSRMHTKREKLKKYSNLIQEDK